MTRNKAIPEISAMDCQHFPSESFSKVITNISKTLKRGCITWLDAFTVGKTRWKIGISQEGILKHHLYIYLSVADDEEELGKGWYREAYFRLTLCQLITPYMAPLILETRMVFSHEKRGYCWSYGTLSKLQNGYVVNDTIEVRASMIILRAFPIAKGDNVVGVDKFEQHVSRLARYLEGVERGSTKVKVSVAKEARTKEMEKARQSLKECLLNPYNGPNVLDKLSEALTTLNLGEILICKTLRFLKDYMEDYWMVQKVNFECEKCMLNKGWLFSMLKYGLFDIIQRKGELDGLIREGARLKGRIKQVSKNKEGAEELTLELERVKDSNIKVFLELEILFESTDIRWSRYRRIVQEAAEAEKEKRAAEERLSVSSKTWSSHMKSLLKQFA